MSYCLSLWWLCIIQFVLLLLTRVPLCHFRCFTPSYLDDFLSFQMLHCHTHRWLWVILGLPMPLAMVVLCHSKWPIATHCSDSVSFLLFGMANFRCFKVAHKGGSTSYKVCKTCSLGRVCVVPGVSLLAFRLTLYFHRCLTTAHKCGLCHLRCTTAAFWLFFVSFLWFSFSNWCCFMSSQLSYSHFMVWLCVIPGVSLPLSQVA